MKLTNFIALFTMLLLIVSCVENNLEITDLNDASAARKANQNIIGAESEVPFSRSLDDANVYLVLNYKELHNTMNYEGDVRDGNFYFITDGVYDGGFGGDALSFKSYVGATYFMELKLNGSIRNEIIGPGNYVIEYEFEIDADGNFIEPKSKIGSFSFSNFQICYPYSPEFNNRSCRPDHTIYTNDITKNSKIVVSGGVFGGERIQLRFNGGVYYYKQYWPGVWGIPELLFLDENANGYLFLSKVVDDSPMQAYLSWLSEIVAIGEAGGRQKSADEMKYIHEKFNSPRLRFSSNPIKP